VKVPPDERGGNIQVQLMGYQGYKNDAAEL